MWGGAVVGEPRLVQPSEALIESSAKITMTFRHILIWCAPPPNLPAQDQKCPTLLRTREASMLTAGRTDELAKG